MQCLAGDPSDGVSGVRGIGPKRGAALINKFGDWQAVAAHVTREGVGATSALDRAIAQAATSGELEKMFEMVKLKPDVPLPVRASEGMSVSVSMRVSVSVSMRVSVRASEGVSVSVSMQVRVSVSMRVSVSASVGVSVSRA